MLASTRVQPHKPAHPTHLRLRCDHHLHQAPHLRDLQAIVHFIFLTRRQELSLTEVLELTLLIFQMDIHTAEDARI